MYDTNYNNTFAPLMYHFDYAIIVHDVKAYIWFTAHGLRDLDY